MMTQQESVSKILSVLSHPLRREILTNLYDNGICSFTDLMRTLEVDTGKLSFHIRTLSALLEQTAGGRYKLSKAGENAMRLILDLESWAESTEVVPKASELPFARWRKRALAFLVDLGLVSAIAVLVTLSNTLSLLTGGSIFRIDIGTTIFVMLLLFWLYSTLLEGFEGQSLGKRLLGLKAVRFDGKRLSYDRAAIRNFGKVFLLPIDLLVGSRLADKRYIRYFDKFAGTAVLDIRQNSVC